MYIIPWYPATFHRHHMAISWSIACWGSEPLQSTIHCTTAWMPPATPIRRRVSLSPDRVRSAYIAWFNV